MKPNDKAYQAAIAEAKIILPEEDLCAYVERILTAAYAAAPDLYAATDWVNKLVEAFGECSGSQYSLNLPGKEIRALIDARRRAREGK